MDNLIIALVCFILINPQMGFAKVNPAQTAEELEAQVTEPGNEETISVMTNTRGIPKLKIGIEPYIPVDAQYSLQNEEESLYIRQAEGLGSETGTESNSGDATER